uniref:Uncharacterized protein n=1 Tax=Panagrolaimus davidi TaxID=227884 RepID=A0A914QIX7_9BILA
MLSYCEKYFKKANQDNSNFVSSASKSSYKFEIRKDETMSAIENLFEALESVVKFNFDNKAENEWIETLLEISGASKTLKELVAKMEPEMKAMNEKVFPTVQELERMDKNWEMVVKSYSEEQKVDIADNGYAFLEPEQLQLVYSGKDKSKLKINLNFYAKLSKEQKQKRIDEDIRKLAKLNPDDIRRARRQIVVHPDNGEITVGNNTNHHDYSQEAPGSHSSVPHFITLSPWAGGYRIGEGFAFEVVTLSPHAFFAEIMMPAAIGVNFMQILVIKSKCF